MTALVTSSVANLVITTFYVVLAVLVVPRAKIRLLATKVGGIGFFALCGLHHAENVAHALFLPDESAREMMVALHMLAIDVPQAVCVILFVTGLYREQVKWGPWSAGAAAHKANLENL
jgi:hypothetical protein